MQLYIEDISTELAHKAITIYDSELGLLIVILIEITG